MTKGHKIILGIFTFLPFILMVLYFGTIVLLVRDALVYRDEDMPFPIVGDVLWLVIMALLAGLLSFGLMIYYIIHAINNPQRLGAVVCFGQRGQLPHLLVYADMEKAGNRDDVSYVVVG